MPRRFDAQEILSDLVNMGPPLTDPETQYAQLTAEQRVERLRQQIYRENKLANWISNRVSEWGLGEVELHGTPRDGVKESEANTDYDIRNNIVIDVKGNGTGRKETMLWYGHYDVVPPSMHYHRIKDKREHTVLTPDSSNPNIVRGLGAYDMLGGITAMLVALKDIKLATNRNIRVLLTYDEEGDSLGFADAVDKGLLENIDCALTTEILVKRNKLQQNHAAMIIGRPGMFGLRVRARGIEEHAGELEDSHAPLLSEELAHEAMQIVKRTPLNRPSGLPPPSTIISSIDGQTQSLSTLSQVQFEAIIQYYDQKQEPSIVADSIRAQLHALAGQRFPGEDQAELRARAFEVKPKKRVNTNTQPFLVDTSKPFSKHMSAILQRASGLNVQHIVDEGTADCGRVYHYAGCDIIGLPPVGGSHHQYDEWIDMRSIPTIAEALRRAAAHEGPITE